jgi:hypothetical protein
MPSKKNEIKERSRAYYLVYIPAGGLFPLLGMSCLSDMSRNDSIKRRHGLPIRAGHSGRDEHGRYERGGY